MNSEKIYEENAVFQALSSVYTGLIFIDLEKDRYSIIRSQEVITSLVEGIDSARQALNCAVQKTVSDDLLDMLAFVNLKTLSQRMKKVKTLSTEYRGIQFGWVRAGFIEMKRNGQGNLEQVLFTYQVIDEEKRKELEHLQKLKDDYAVTEKRKEFLEADNKVLADDLTYNNNFSEIIMDQIDCGVMAYSLPGRNLLQVNREALRIRGWKDLDDASDQFSNGRENITYLDESDVKKLIALKDRDASVKYRFVIDAGLPTEKHILAESKSLSGRHGGKVIISSFVDITHVLNLEEDKRMLTSENTELQQARDAVHTILKAGSYICSYDETGKKLLNIKYSDALRKLYGYTDKTDAPDIWALWEKSIYPEDRKYVEESYHAALEDCSGNTDYDVTYRAVRKDGSLCWHRAAGYVIRRKDGTSDTCYGFVMDVDAQKKAADKVRKALKQAQLANEAKTSFLARMSHDIRTPMNGIMGLIEINEKHADDIKFTSENRQKAKVAADHLLSLINDVLQLSKLEDSNIELTETPFDMISLLDDIFTIIEMKANENGITVERKNAPSIFEYPYVWGSPLHVRQIYINILGNSIKYNKKNGHIYCSTSTKRTDANHVSCKIIIKDTGIGMSEEFQKHLFDPFSREHEDLSGKYEGTGLGMSIVKQLTDKMGGKIRVESKVGEGSSFTVEIPFELASEEELEKTKESYRADNIKGKHILLVEDNELNMDIAEILLLDAGAKVSKAVNGRQAVEAFEENLPGTFDVILMDVMMPVMNGYEATRCIRSLEREDAGEIPIIAMTANAFAEDVEKAKQAGMNAHLAKPLDIRNMMYMISKYAEN